jgi:nitrogen fixation NifU-like protein
LLDLAELGLDDESGGEGPFDRRGARSGTQVQRDDVDRGNGDGEEQSDAEVKLGDLEALQGVVKFPVRIKCATLAWNTLTEALAEATSA